MKERKKIDATKKSRKVLSSGDNKLNIIDTSKEVMIIEEDVQTIDTKGISHDGINRQNRYVTNIKPKLKEIEKWTREGLSDTVICERLEIGIGTYNNYKLRETHLSESIKRGQEISNKEVETSMFRRANGYQFTCEKTTTTKRNGDVVVKEVTRDVPASEIAGIFWLTNRKPDEWKRNRDGTVLTGKDGKPVSITFIAVDSKGKEMK